MQNTLAPVDIRRPEVRKDCAAMAKAASATSGARPRKDKALHQAVAAAAVGPDGAPLGLPPDGKPRGGASGAPPHLAINTSELLVRCSVAAAWLGFG